MNFPLDYLSFSRIFFLILGWRSWYSRNWTSWEKTNCPSYLPSTIELISIIHFDCKIFFNSRINSVKFQVNILLITTLKMNHHGMRFLRFQEFTNKKTSETEKVGIFLKLKTHNFSDRNIWRILRRLWHDGG